MLINSVHYHSIWLDEKNPNVVKFINQNQLPFRFVIDELRTPEDAHNAIKEMKVRGAPLIGVTGAYGVYLACIVSKKSSPPEEYITGWADKISKARPTAVNLHHAINRIMKSISDTTSVNNKILIAKQTTSQIAEEERRNCYQIGLNGLPLIEEISRKKKGKSVNILTHCNAGWLACIDYGTATAPIYLAHDKGIKVHVWVDETRPRNQGARLTAWELKHHGVPYTVIVDNAGGHLMQQGMVDIVLVGSDRTTRAGDVANKIGTYLKALSANDNNIPFYVALPSSSFDFSITQGLSDIPIEERSEDEVKYMEGLLAGKTGKVQIIPDNYPVANFGFDITPARLVTSLITERGICNANEKDIKNLFPEHH